MAKRKKVDAETAAAQTVCDQAWEATEGGGLACALELAKRNNLHPAAVYRILSVSPFFRHHTTCKWERLNA